MRRRSIFLAVAFFQLLLLNPVASQVYVSSLTGDDTTGTGLSDGPFKSLGRALTERTGTDHIEVIMAEGTYDSIDDREHFILYDTTITGQGSVNISCGESADAGFRVFYVQSGKTVLSNLDISNCGGNGIGGGISVSTRENLVTEVVMSDITIRDCSSDVGGALGIAGTNAVVSCTDCVLENNTSGKGGAVYVLGGTISLTRTVFRSNRALLGGGYSTDAATVHLTDVDFTLNSARSAGCAYMFSSVLEYANGKLLNNLGDDDDGGGLYLVASAFVLSDLLFQDNLSSDDGGAIRILLTLNDRPQTFTRLTFINNQCGDKGGAVYSSGGNLQIRDCSWHNNFAAENGGGLALNGGNCNLADLTFEDNWTDGNGGQMYVKKTVVEMRRLHMNRSSAAVGGSFYFTRSPSVLLQDSELLNSEGFAEGGAITWDGTTGTLVNVTIQGCTSPLGGAAIVYSEMNTEDCLVSGNTADDGGGILVLEGGLGEHSGTRFEANTANRGGGVFVTTGGGFSTAPGGEVTFSGNTAVGGADNNGGGLYVEAGGSAHVVGSMVDNEAGYAGGGVYAFSPSDVDIAGAVASGNVARYGELSAGPSSILKVRQGDSTTVEPGPSLPSLEIVPGERVDVVLWILDGFGNLPMIDGEIVVSVTVEDEGGGGGMANATVVLSEVEQPSPDHENTHVGVEIFPASPHAVADVVFTVTLSAGGRAVSLSQSVAVSFEGCDPGLGDILGRYEQDPRYFMCNDAELLCSSEEHSTYTVSECDADSEKRRIEFEWIDPVVCQSIALSPTVEIDCDMVSASSGTGSLVVGLAILGLVVSVGFACFIMAYAHKPVIKFAQKPFCLLFILGAGLSCLSTLAFLGENTDGNCILRPWLFHLSLTLMFGSLLVKVWRVWRVFDNPNMKKISIGNSVLYGMLGKMLLLDLLLLVVWSVVMPPQRVARVRYEVGVGEVTHYECESDRSELPTAALLYKAGLILVGCFLAFKTRHVDGRFSEAKHIFLAIYNIAIVGGLTLLLTQAMDISTSSSLMLQSIGTVWCACVSLACVFVPKIMMINVTSASTGATGTSYAPGPTLQTVGGGDKVTPYTPAGEGGAGAAGHESTMKEMAEQMKGMRREQTEMLYMMLSMKRQMEQGGGAAAAYSSGNGSPVKRGAGKTNKQQGRGGGEDEEKDYADDATSRPSLDKVVPVR